MSFFADTADRRIWRKNGRDRRINPSQIKSNQDFIYPAHGKD